MASLILVTGGCRSGKSDFAQQCAEQLSDRLLFIATCPDTDTEMAERIHLHQKARSHAGWRNIEEQLSPAKVIRRSEPGMTILVDCLTLWISNLLFDADRRGRQLREHDVNILAEDMAAAGKEYDGTVIMVTGEVGQGIVPDNSLARTYRDLVGRCNRIVAAAADQVFLVSCGIPLQLK
jgi:adenosylcobinamide kinase/adenosylcobinamide-phosphate guanylyltransferase